MPFRLPEVFEGKFTGIRRVNLNENLVMREPAIAEMRTNMFPCLFYGHFAMKQLDVIAKAPFSGYAPGQTIDLLLNVANTSLEPVAQFSVELMRQIDFVSRSRFRLRATRSEIVTLVEKFTKGCGARSSQSIHANILVPDTPPTDTTVTQVIKIHYFIRVIAKMDRFHFDPMMEMPIVIGSHPIIGEPYGQIAVQTPKKPSKLELNLENLTNADPILSSEPDPRILAQKNENMLI